MVPFLDLQAGYLELKPELDAAYQRVMNSGWYILGGEVEQFESEFSDYCGVHHCLGVGSGLDAISLILRGYGIGCGDEVIVPVHTFIATWLGISHTGARVVPVAVDPATYNLDPASVEAAIIAKTKAIIAVHLYGYPADMNALRRISSQHGIKLIEDAAQAHGVGYFGRKTGALGDAAAFSFYPGKNLGAYGDGGAVVTNDEVLSKRIGSLRNYGSAKKYHHEEIGYNSRLDPLQAALLRVRLKHLDEWTSRRRKIANRYLEKLCNLNDLILPPSQTDSIQPVWHLFVVRTARRDALQKHLEKAGVQTLIHYPVANHRADAYANEFGQPKSWRAQAESLADSVLSLPMGPHLSEARQEVVVKSVAGFFGRV